MLAIFNLAPRLDGGRQRVEAGDRLAHEVARLGDQQRERRKVAECSAGNKTGKSFRSRDMDD